ncbi:MAG: hypothetical protein ACYTF1_16785, partial [Planctomycetota bacterium]
TGTFWMLRAIRDRDESLMWLVLAILASLAGAVSLITLAISNTVIDFYEYLLRHFFWTNLTLAGMEWIGTTILVGSSWIVNGLVLATLAPVLSIRAESHRRPPGVAAGVLIGLGLAWFSHQRWADQGLSGNQMYLIGILPMFVLAGLSAWFSQHVEHQRLALPPAETDAPEVSAGTEGLIWLSLVVWGVGSVLVGIGWLSSQSIAAGMAHTAPGRFSWYVLTLGIGMAVALYYSRGRKRSASGCGMAIWGAGLGAVAAATLSAIWPERQTSAVFQVIVLALPVGYALHYIESAWLARVGSETLGFAQMASAVLSGSAIGLIVGRWWALPTLGPLGVMTAGSLMLLAFGGLMQIYEEKRPLRVKHLRLAMVFGSLALAIVILPLDAHWWVRWERLHRLHLSGHIGYNRLAEGHYNEADNICLIGADPRLALDKIEDKRIKVDVCSMVSVYEISEPVGQFPYSLNVCRTGVFRKFRLERQRYNLIYQRNNGSARLRRFAEYSTEWFNQMAEHVSLDGTAIVDVPLNGMTIDALATIAATFQYSFSSPADWRLDESKGGHYLRLKSTFEAKHDRTTADVKWLPVDLMLKDRRNYRPHSIICDRLTPLIDNKDVKNRSSSSTIAWLKRIHNSATDADSF